MKLTTFASFLLPITLGLTSVQASATVIIFDFLKRVESQGSGITARFVNGGERAASSKKLFVGNKGPSPTPGTQNEIADAEAEDYRFLPSFGHVRSGFAAFRSSYTGHKVIRNFGEFDEVANTDYLIDEGDPSSQGGGTFSIDGTSLDALAGTVVPVRGGGDSVTGLLYDKKLSSVHPHAEPLIEAVNVPTAAASEPANWGVMLLGLLMVGVVRYRVGRQSEPLLQRQAF